MEILNELQLIKEAAEEAVALTQDPLVADWLGSVATTAGGYIDQLTPRAAGTDVQFAEAPRPQQPVQAAPEQEAAEGTPAPEAANADAGGAEDEPEPDPTPTLGPPSTEDRASESEARPDETRTSERHATSHRRRPSA